MQSLVDAVCNDPTYGNLVNLRKAVSEIGADGASAARVVPTLKMIMVEDTPAPCLDQAVWILANIVASHAARDVVSGDLVAAILRCASSEPAKAVMATNVVWFIANCLGDKNCRSEVLRHPGVLTFLRDSLAIAEGDTVVWCINNVIRAASREDDLVVAVVRGFPEFYVWMMDRIQVASDVSRGEIFSYLVAISKTVNLVLTPEQIMLWVQLMGSSNPVMVGNLVAMIDNYAGISPGNAQALFHSGAVEALAEHVMGAFPITVISIVQKMVESGLPKESWMAHQELLGRIIEETAADDIKRTVALRCVMKMVAVFEEAPDVCVGPLMRGMLDFPHLGVPFAAMIERLPEDQRIKFQF